MEAVVFLNKFEKKKKILVDPSVTRTNSTIVQNLRLLPLPYKQVDRSADKPQLNHVISI